MRKKTILSKEDIIEIFISSKNAMYYRKRYKVTIKVIEEIKNKIIFDDITKNLGLPGIIYRQTRKLTDKIIKEIQNYDLTEKELSIKYNINVSAVQYWRRKKSIQVDWQNIDQMIFRKLF